MGGVGHEGSWQPACDPNTQRVEIGLMRQPSPLGLFPASDSLFQNSKTKMVARTGKIITGVVLRPPQAYEHTHTRGELAESNIYN